MATSTSAASISVSASGSVSAASASTSTSGKSGIASPSTSVICEEVFDETEPSPEEIHDYALMVGIDPVKEPHLLYLAKEGLMQALPTDWKICYSEVKGGHYYFNTKTKQSQWDHPLDAVYRELVEQARQKHTTIAATPVIDNSDDASQLDSGIRSLQGNDECDNTNNTNDMSSPVSNVNANCTTRPANGNVGSAIGIAVNASTSSCSAANGSSTSGFSGGVSRFLESRSKNFGFTFQPTKGLRFETAKSNPNPQISLAMKFSSDGFPSKLAAANKVEPDLTTNGATDKRGFVLSGTGAMFLKSRKQMEAGLNQATTAMLTDPSTSNIIIEGAAGTPPGVKSILRDSSLTDMRRTLNKEDLEVGGVAEDKKSVRFNLEETKIRGSPEEEPSSSRKLTQSPDASVCSDDDEAEDDPWDDDDDKNNEVEGCVGYSTLGAEGGAPRSLNPFLVNDEKHLKDIQVISVPKSQTIQMLKAQSLSMDLPERDRVKLSELARSQSIESSNIPQPSSVVSYLEKLKDSSTTIKPLYEDTDSESKGSSVRSFIINKSEQDSVNSIVPAANPFESVENINQNNYETEQSDTKSESEKPPLCTFKVASKLVGFLKKDTDKNEKDMCSRTKIQNENDEEYKVLQQNAKKEKMALLKEERERLEDVLQNEIDTIKSEHEKKLKNIRQEYDTRLTSHRHEMEQSFQKRLQEYREQLEEELNMKRKVVVDEHKAHMTTLQKNHSEILQDLERDLKSEEEILKKEHARKHTEMLDKLTHELESERQRMRETGEDRLYEKVRCEKRLLEDKYRCLKEKYVRLKTDVKLSLERRNRRREAQALHQQSMHTNTTTTGSETERSISNKPSIGNSENRSLSLSTSCQEHGGIAVGKVPNTVLGGKNIKPPVPPKTHLTTVTNNKDHGRSGRDRSTERAPMPMVRKPGIASKYIKQLQGQDDTTTSISQSDTTISNNYNKGRYLPPPVVSDNGNSDSEAAFQYNQENNNNGRSTGQRNKVFSRTKSASTSRLNNSENYKTDRPCTPVENLRHQLQKLEDLEDQFPANTLDATYHLRYPFSDISNDRAGVGNSSELEFFKHRIHLERDSVRRAKESLRTQRTNFRARQREIKQCHKASTIRHSLDQLIQEEKELTEMEVNLHRTRALLGEKVIRLRHLEQSLLRIYEKERPTMDFLGVEQKEDTTLSDLSSHSSSGFSSTDFASGGDTQNLHKRKETYHQESTECIQNLEILNAEIREILDILGKSQQHGGIPMISPSELNWSHMLSAGTSPATTPHGHPQGGGSNASLMHAPQSIPTLADRLETYRQLATGRMQNSMGGAILAANTIVSQSPRAVNYTTSLVERTRDLRNWLRQAKTEHELLTGGSGTNVGAIGANNSISMIGSRECGGMSGIGVGVATAATTGGGGGTGTQTNL